MCGIMIFMVMVLNELGDIECVVEVGMNDFFFKLVNKVELLKCVENMLVFKDVVNENE